MERIKVLLNDVKNAINLNENVKIKVVPMKQKIASISLRTKILRLNKNIIEKLNDEELRYIIAHELIHLKVKDINHGSLFWRELEKVFSSNDIVNLEIDMIKKLLS
ncbi:hypothetical protein ABOONEI_506 [Aciduliprofundum boonei T469]|nr:hypothetical protein ABOONEI_506 [Aciduliprofundum boonei T469]